MTALLEMEALTRRFGGLTAVDAVSGEVREGELVGLIGPTAPADHAVQPHLRLHPATAASALPRPPLTACRRRRRTAGIGRTFQNLRVFPNMTAFDNVAVGAAGRLGHSVRDALSRSPAARPRLEPSARPPMRPGPLRPPRRRAELLAAQLAYGKRKYLEIARALATDPACWSSTSPPPASTTAKPPSSPVHPRLNAGGLSILLVEHDMGLVMSTCQRVLVSPPAARSPTAPRRNPGRRSRPRSLSRHHGCVQSPRNAAHFRGTPDWHPS
jgi:branched-chain amino acid transport system ATP-binding protein